MLLVILSGFTGSFLAPLIYRITRKKTGLVLALIPFCLCLYLSSFISVIEQQGAVYSSIAWVPAMGVSLSFCLDGLSILFGAIITFIGGLVMVYAGSYFPDSTRTGRFYALILMFMSAMLGTVLAGNLITLFVFWELTGISSFLLIGFDHEREFARKAAWQALLVTGSGGLAMLAGFLLLGQVSGSYEFSVLLTKGDIVRNHSLYPAIFLLILLGAFTKSAQFPFHFWLPDAMEAPTPVSTYLHSATMVKAGIYLLARLSPILGGTPIWHTVLVFMGAVTMLAGAWLAVRQSDLKRILAYSTVSVLGTLTFLIGIGTQRAVEAALAYVMIHALYKASLFLVAGIVDHETGTRDIYQLHGLRRIMPVTGIAALMAGFSMAGLPPLFGFIGKELLYGATLETPAAASILTVVALLTNSMMVIAAGLVSVIPFSGQNESAPKHANEPSPSMWIGPAMLAGLGIFIGLFPDYLAGRWVSPAAAAILQKPVSVELGLLHGLTLQLALSALTFGAGLAGFVWRKKLLHIMNLFTPVFRKGPSHVYTFMMDQMTGFARLQTRLLQNGHLHYYILIIIVTTVVLVGPSILNHAGTIELISRSNILPYEWILMTVILSGTALVVRAERFIIAIVALGVVGYSVVLFYILYSAPDLAMTQFAIDTLTVIMLVLVIYRLPNYITYSTRLERVRDGLPSIAAGGLMTVLILTALAESHGSSLYDFFVNNSLSAAKGRNIVNVILVDFRGLDTLGEVTVLTVAGIGVFSLLKLTLSPKDRTAPEEVGKIK
jgi:multicomponent Na+:H+ antiporter subunit A